MARTHLWLPCAAMMLMSVINYIDRNTLVVLAPTILADTRLTNLQYGWLMSGFSIVYMVVNPLWGRLLDRVDLWIAMFVAVAFWSLASASHALADTLAGFMTARVLLALGEGAAVPGGLRAVTQTLPADWRARGIAVVYGGGPLGALLTPLVLTPVALAFGWRAAFLMTGLLGVAWLILWWRLGRDHRLREIPPPLVGEPVSFADRRLWGFMAVNSLGALPLGFVLYIAPIYLHQALGQSQADLGRLLWIPPLGWGCGYFFWGWLVDRLLTRSREPMALFRRLIAMLTLLGSTLATTPLLTHLVLVMAELFFAMFVSAGFIIVALSYATHVFTARQAGFIGGAGVGSWSAAVALTMPVFGGLFDMHSYGSAFLVATLAPFVGAALWWNLSRNAPSA